MVALVSMAKMAEISIRVFLLLVILLPGISPAHAQETQSSSGVSSWWQQNIWQDPDRGFYWYPPDPVKQKKESPDKTAKKEDQKKSIYEMTTSEEVNKELKRLLDGAIFNPTQENVYEYQKAKAWTLEKAAVFADIGRRVTWQNPDIDYNTKVPLATFGRFEMKENIVRQQSETFAKLSKDHGILFFYRSDCPYCHKQAPVLLELKKRHGIEILAISMDGGPIPGFPDAKPDNGISQFVTGGVGIETVPATYLVSNDKKSIVPIGSGLLAMDEFVDRIQLLTQTKPGERF